MALRDKFTRPITPLRPFRTGLVEEIDAARARVRVNFPDFDRVQSYWLPVLAGKSQDDKFYWMPDVGEQVVCLLDERDEAGCVLGAIYSTADAPPVTSAEKAHVTFKDGAIIEYDRASHELRIAEHEHLTILFKDGSKIVHDGAAPGMLIEVVAAGSLTLKVGGAQIALVGNQVQITPPPIVYAEAFLV